QDDTASTGAVVQGGGLALAKTVLTFDFKDDRYPHPTAGLKLVVQIDEFASQSPGKPTADGRLACPHHAYQENRQIMRQARARTGFRSRTDTLGWVSSGGGCYIGMNVHAGIIPSPAGCPLTTLNEFVTETP